MPEGFDPLRLVKRILVMHLLRQQIEADLGTLQKTPLRLRRSYASWLERLHASLLKNVGELKGELRRHGVRVIRQQKNSLDFQIAYLERGYEVQHCFLLATLHAEAEALFVQYLEGGPP
jgi:hypothetical protein